MSSSKTIKVIKGEDKKNPLFFLSFKNLSLIYSDDKKIFSDINLNIGYNQLVVIKGVVGSGKSSLLKLLAGVINYDGKISNADINGEELKPIFIHSQYEFNFLTGYLKEEAILSGVSLDLIDKKYHDKSIYNLSGGELKRLSVNIAINQPDYNLLLLDEPLDMLDDYWYKEVAMQIISNLGKKLFIIATHDDIFDEYADTILEIV